MDAFNNDVHSFNVRNLMSKESKGNKLFKKVNTLDTSHVNLYFGKDGLGLNNPFINLVKEIEFLLHLSSLRAKI